MKQHIKQLLLSACTFFLFCNTHSALADTASDTETLLNWCQSALKTFQVSASKNFHLV